MCSLYKTCLLYIHALTLLMTLMNLGKVLNRDSPMIELKKYNTPLMTLMNLGEVLKRNTLFLGARTLSTPLQTRFRFRAKIDDSILGIVGV